MDTVSSQFIYTYDWIIYWTYSFIQNHDNNYLNLWLNVIFSTVCAVDLFNVFFTNVCVDYFPLESFLDADTSTILIKNFDLFSSWLTLFYVFTPEHLSYSSAISWLNINFMWDFSITNFFFLLYSFLFIWKFSIDSVFFFNFFSSSYMQVVNLYIYSWVLGGIDKTESTEEIISLLILWPWCIIIIFSHVLTISNHNFFFGFAEWGLPIIYGLILLLEHCWSFGTYLLVYLNGTRGKKSLIVTLIEDLMALSILIARVLLQAVRGVIVGMFHFICREALLNLTHWWTISHYINSCTSLDFEGLTFKMDFINLAADLVIACVSLVIVTAIMFLQLIFLVVSVWLFCKCWFISWHPTITTQLDVKPTIKFVYVKSTAVYSLKPQI